MSKRSRILVFLQFAALGYFTLSGQLFAQTFPLLTIQFAGIVMALWGIIAMRIGNFNVQPEVKKTAVFVRKGPYRLIRNPMYLGIILFFGVSALVYFSYMNLIIYLILCTVLLLKIRMEETFLRQKFGRPYQEYLQGTYRLIPFVY